MPKTSQIDELIADQEKSIELLEEYRKAVISEAVTKGLDPNAPMKDSGIDWIGEIPKEWGQSKMKYLCRITSGSVNTLQRAFCRFGKEASHGFPQRRSSRQKYGIRNTILLRKRLSPVQQNCIPREHM